MVVVKEIEEICAVRGGGGGREVMVEKEKKVVMR